MRGIGVHPAVCLSGVLLILLGLVVAPVARSAGNLPLESQPVICVGLRVDVLQTVIACRGKLRVWRRGTGLRPSVLSPGVELRLLPARMAPWQWDEATGVRSVEDWGLVLSRVRQGRLGVFAEELVFEPVSPGEPVYVDGRPYRGEVLVRVSRPEALTVINAVHIEDYLRGVVPPELGRGPDMPAEALKAQAIASRSYALFHLGRHPERSFDVYAGVEDQMYGGTEVETDEGTRAVRATQGVVALYKGRPIRANYSSTCGGRTEASGRVWPGEAYPYLRSVSDRAGGEALCSGSPRFTWTEKWRCRGFERKILEHLPEEVPAAAERPPQKVTGLKIGKRSPSGRVEVLVVETDTGEYRVRGDRIRWILRRSGDRPLWSTLFEKLQRSGDGPNCMITLKGHGYGHGAGMCQTGAIERARRGSSTGQILRHYYRGIRLQKWW